MDKEKLKKYAEDGLSTYKIAKKFGKSQTNIRYWLSKYGIVTNAISKINKIEYICKNCKNKFLSYDYRAVFCSVKCSSEYMYNITRGKIMRGEKVSSKTLRRHLIDMYGNKCMKKDCGWDWSKECTVEVEHKDGN